MIFNEYFGLNKQVCILLMYWDSFFRQLSAENQKKEKYLLCTCREAGKGCLIHEGGKLRFIGQCSHEKACFKIRFDSKRILSRKLQIVSKPKTKKEKKQKVLHLTLDMFLNPSYSFIDPKKGSAK